MPHTHERAHARTNAHARAHTHIHPPATTTVTRQLNKQMHRLVIPGVAGVAVWSPCLNNSGSSARGVAFTKALVETFAFHHLESATRSKKIDPTQPRLSKTSAGKVEILAACSGGDLRTVKAAYARGGDLNAADYDSRTPLHVAASNGWYVQRHHHAQSACCQHSKLLYCVIHASALYYMP